MPKIIQNKNIRNLSKHSSCKHRFCEQKMSGRCAESRLSGLDHGFLAKLKRSVWERNGLVHIHIKSNKTSKAVQDQYLQNLHLNNLNIYTVQARGKHTTLQRTAERPSPGNVLFMSGHAHTHIQTNRRSSVNKRLSRCGINSRLPRPAAHFSFEQDLSQFHLVNWKMYPAEVHIIFTL